MIRNHWSEKSRASWHVAIGESSGHAIGESSDQSFFFVANGGLFISLPWESSHSNVGKILEPF